MIVDYGGEFFKPEHGNLVKDLALIRNWIIHNHIEGRDSISSDDEEMVLHFVNIPNLSAGNQREIGKICLPNGFHTIFIP